MSPQLEAVLKQAQGLSPSEQLQLIEHLTAQVSTQSETEARVSASKIVFINTDF